MLIYKQDQQKAKERERERGKKEYCVFSKYPKNRCNNNKNKIFV
jgi:hypothetical protein